MKKEQSFEIHEQIIAKLTYDIGREATALGLSHYDVDADVIAVGEQTYKKIMSHPQTYQSLMGMIEVPRHIYSNRKKDGDGKSICPLELQSGIIEGQWTPNAAKNAVWILAHLPAQETEDLLLQLGAMNPSRSSLDRLPKALHVHFAKEHMENYEIIIKEEKIPDNAVSVAVSLDGCMVAMKPAKTGEKSKEKLKCEWREASCGTISFYDEEGERLSTIQYGCMPEHKKATLKMLLKKNIEEIQKKHNGINLIHIADGAQDNWTFFDEEMPHGFQVTDFFHACEYLKKAFESAYKNNQEKAIEQFKKYKGILLEEIDGIKVVIRAMRYLRDTHNNDEVINASLTYFLNNQHRMRYAKARELNYPIGSGVIEATCKSLVGQRLKRSGMSWCLQGGQAILTFRALVKSLRFEKGWELIAKQYKKGIEIYNNVVAFPEKVLN